MAICSFVQSGAPVFRAQALIFMYLVSGVLSTSCVQQEVVTTPTPVQVSKPRAVGTTAPLSGVVEAVFGSSGSAWVLNYKGELLFTRDAGKSWSNLGGEAVKNFDTFTLTQGRVGLAADSDGNVWRSDDGGQSWRLMSTLKRADPAERYMMASQIEWRDHGSKAWIVDIFAVWSTTDGGRSWQEVNDLSFRVLKRQLRHISFLNHRSLGNSAEDPRFGWSVGDAGLILHTSDGGVTWRALGKDLPFNLGTSINALEFVSPTHGWLAVADASEPYPERVVLVTTDGGNSWRQQKDVSDRISISSIFFIDNNNGWMAGGEEVSGNEVERAVLLKSSNGGRTWQRAGSLPATDAIKEVYFSSSNEGWFFTDYDLFRTDDGGKSWVSVLSYPEVRQKEQ